MAWLNTPIAPQLAVERGWTSWNLFVGNWGLAAGVPGNDVNSLLFPNPASQAIIPSIAGVAIGPLSDIDRCFIGYNPNLEVGTIGGSAGNYNITDQTLLSVDSPITYPQSGVISVNYDARIRSLASFIPDNGTGVAQAFNFDTGNPGIAPTLHLVFYLQQTIIPQLGRYPTVRSAAFAGVAAGAESLVQAIPVFGRKQANITVRNTSANAISLRVGLVTPPANSGVMIERTLQSITGIPLNGVEAFTFGADLHNATYLTFWVNPAGPAVGAGDIFVELTDTPGGGCTCTIAPIV